MSSMSWFLYLPERNWILKSHHFKMHIITTISQILCLLCADLQCGISIYFKITALFENYCIIFTTAWLFKWYDSNMCSIVTSVLIICPGLLDRAYFRLSFKLFLIAVNFYSGSYMCYYSITFISNDLVCYSVEIRI